MKRIKLLALLLIGLLASCNTNDEPTNSTKAELSYPISEAICGIATPLDTYQYPFYPGTEEWRIESERVGDEKMQEYYVIPQNILKSISTAGLVRSFLDNPEILLIGASNNTNTYPYYLSWTKKMPIATILEELYTREDSASKTIAMYEAFKPNAQWIWFMDIIDMHVKLVNLLLEPAIFERLSQEEKVVLIQTAIEKMELCAKEDVHYWANEDMLLGKIMLSESFQPMIEFYKESEVKDCIDNGAYLSIDNSSKMVDLADNFIKNME